MSTSPDVRCIAFAGTRLIAAGPLRQIALTVKAVHEREEREPVLIFDETTSEPIEVDFRGADEEVLERLEAAVVREKVEDSPTRGPGRPRLGVVGREVTLLPRHWEWLGRQPGGASIALRKLVENARRAGEESDRMRQARESAYRFLSTMAGNLGGFEEANRALFAGDRDRFRAESEGWPEGIRDHARKLFEATLPAA